MAHPKKETLNIFDKIDRKLGKTKFLIKKRMNWVDPVIIFPYISYGTNKEVFVLGRVLEQEGITDQEDSDSIFTNLAKSYKRYESDEIPHVRIQVTLDGETEVVETDEEGFYTACLHPKEKLPGDQIWHKVKLELLDQVVDGQKKVEIEGDVIIPNENSKFGVISDVDDTVLVSHSTELFRKAYLIFTKNAKSRSPFPGVSAFYQALSKEDGKFRNPIFYITSSPWNLFDLLDGFLEAHEIPRGPMLMSDMGISDEHFIKAGHRKHKIEKIEKILDTYPDLSFVLIGDSGQKDAEIYEEIVKKYTTRIHAIYIRDVSGDKRKEAVTKIAESVKKLGVDMILCEDTLDAANHALGQNLIPEEAITAIKKDIQDDKSRPE